MSHASDSMELFERGPALLREAAAGLDRDQLLARPIPGKWSVLEVVCHLVDSEQAWCHRMKRVISEDRPLLVGYDESKFTASLDYSARDVATELDLFEGMRRQMAFILKRLPAIAWARVGVHTERGLVSLAEMVQIEAEHVAGHLVHIQDKRKALGL